MLVQLRISNILSASIIMPYWLNGKSEEGEKENTHKSKRKVHSAVSIPHIKIYMMSFKQAGYDDGSCGWPSFQCHTKCFFLLSSASLSLSLSYSLSLWYSWCCCCCCGFIHLFRKSDWTFFFHFGNSVSFSLKWCFNLRVFSSLARSLAQDSNSVCFLWLFDLFSPHYSIDFCGSPSFLLKLVRTISGNYTKNNVMCTCPLGPVKCLVWPQIKTTIRTSTCSHIIATKRYSN